MKKGDIGLIAAVLLVAAAFYFVPGLFARGPEPAGGKAYAKITVDGKPYRLVELNDRVQEVAIQTERGNNILKVHDFGIEMIEANCPDRICITFGFNDRIGKTIVCLPNRVLVEIVGPPGEGGGPDAVAA